VDTDVLADGAGPVGLLLAAELALAGVRGYCWPATPRTCTHRTADRGSTSV
jgi:hypothetical protein